MSSTGLSLMETKWSDASDPSTHARLNPIQFQMADMLSLDFLNPTTAFIIQVQLLILLCGSNYWVYHADASADFVYADASTVFFLCDFEYWVDFADVS